MAPCLCFDRAEKKVATTLVMKIISALEWNINTSPMWLISELRQQRIAIEVPAEVFGYFLSPQKVTEKKLP
jgi:hypothetical protein